MNGNRDPEQEIIATLRDGSEHVLVLGSSDDDAAHLLNEVIAGRSQFLRGWIAVQPPSGAAQAVVSGDEIVQLRLVAHEKQDETD